MSKSAFLLILLLAVNFALAQEDIPKVYTNIGKDAEGYYYLNKEGEKLYAENSHTNKRLSNMQNTARIKSDGLYFNFKTDDFEGKIYYGLIDFNDSKHPMPVWFKRTADIENGKAYVNITKKLSGRYDMTNWEETGKGTLAYRIQDDKGNFLYEGIINFKYKNDKLEPAITVIEGPFINKLSDTEVSVWFNTDTETACRLSVESKTYTDEEAVKHHEFRIKNLKPSTRYQYTLNCDGFEQSYAFKTAHSPGARKPFVFAYASDSRAGQGGGERNMHGTNYYVMRQIAALVMQEKAAFMQFTGDLVNGYSTDKDVINLEYANWKRAVEPFWHYFPIASTVGNHEVIGKKFGEWDAFVTGFPFETESSAAVYAKNFVNPENGPKSEDGAYYDPDPNKPDFPPYKETVYYYSYDNVAVIVLNSDYFYTPTLSENPRTGGNLHAYIMDKQLEWLEQIVAKLEKDNNIDHIFVTQHTPAFPNGGHVEDDMWYLGENKYRPVVAGKPVNKGILERRDEYLDILINKSSKVVAILTGDEHNYNKVEISPEVNIYPDDYPKKKKIKRRRTLWQINNGSAGAPYYAQDTRPPWTDAVSGFSTQYAVVFIAVEGEKVNVTVKNPITLEVIEEYTLRD